jgi:hypothetical protein
MKHAAILSTLLTVAALTATQVWAARLPVRCRIRISR